MKRCNLLQTSRCINANLERLYPIYNNTNTTYSDNCYFDIYTYIYTSATDYEMVHNNRNNRKSFYNCSSFI